MTKLKVLHKIRSSCRSSQPGGEREVVDPPAGSQGGGDDGGLGYQVHGAEVAHALQKDTLQHRSFLKAQDDVISSSLCLRTNNSCLQILYVPISFFSQKIQQHNKPF